MKKRFVVFLLTFSATLFGSAIEKVEEKQADKTKINWSPYIGVSQCRKETGLLFGLETQYIEIPFFQRFSFNGFASMTYPPSSSVSMSAFHYWTSANRPLRLFTRFSVYNVNLYIGRPKDVEYWYGIFGLSYGSTLGVEYENARHSIFRLELKISSAASLAPSIMYVF